MLIESKKDLMVLKQCLQDEMDFHSVAEIEGYGSNRTYNQHDVWKLLDAVNTSIRLLPQEEQKCNLKLNYMALNEPVEVEFKIDLSGNDSFIKAIENYLEAVKGLQRASIDIEFSIKKKPRIKWWQFWKRIK